MSHDKGHAAGMVPEPGMMNPNPPTLDGLLLNGLGELKEGQVPYIVGDTCMKCHETVRRKITQVGHTPIFIETTFCHCGRHITLINHYFIPD